MINRKKKFKYIDDIEFCGKKGRCGVNLSRKINIKSGNTEKDTL